MVSHSLPRKGGESAGRAGLELLGESSGAGLGPPGPGPATPSVLSAGRPLEVREELGQCLFLVWNGVTRGASHPFHSWHLAHQRRGAGDGEELPAEPWASQHGWVKTLSQARLTFPRGTRASHPGPAPGLPLLPSVALGPRALSQLPGAARFLGRQLSAHAQSPLGVSPRAGSPDPIHTGREGRHPPAYLEPYSYRVPYPTTSSCS